MLVTGGTGSFGAALVRRLLADTGVARIVVYSRDEHKQAEVRRSLGNDARVRWFIGDVRDYGRLAQAMAGMQFVVHAAALKQVDTAERHPSEFVKTNVNGSQNVVDAAIQAGVQRVIALSTDKACRPVSLYGATKLIADKLMISANHTTSDAATRFAVVRYGNVLGSRGSVIPLFRDLARAGISLPLTDKRMTRFWITLPQAVEFVIASFSLMSGGELYVPRIPTVRLVDLAEAIAPGLPAYEIGIRPGEKLHEELIATDDSHRTVRLGERYVVEPVDPTWSYRSPMDAEPVPDGFGYASDNDDGRLSVEQLRSLLTAEAL
ncbi:UDP-N-acetylglucosamine 4,6-dehydratase (inverting) [Dactylosporangium matsuzakiense]|uniref:UDP-N-acetylglucosamine 4,6-dehydratase (Inverting) n=2 Tax=Dactylosporangium matsuzakiense TaxID=53360 RepID=A0A9W6NM88_9ACTN|nr:UDP-N-acetylglucosamine 4,6-dehydratase (inverting) [Dactylosporangium matsuzakiense]